MVATKKLAALIFAGALAAGCLAACSSGGSNSGGSEAEAPAATSEAAAPAETSEAVEPAAEPPAEPAAVEGAAITADDLATVDVEVAFGDYDGMNALSSDIQNGNATDKVVKVDGVVMNFAKGMSYSVGEENEEAGSTVGTKFIIIGVEEDAYPTDTTHIILTGKVMQDPESSAFVLYTLPEFVEVVEE